MFDLKVERKLKNCVLKSFFTDFSFSAPRNLHVEAFKSLI